MVWRRTRNIRRRRSGLLDLCQQSSVRERESKTSLAAGNISFRRMLLQFLLDGMRTSPQAPNPSRDQTSARLSINSWPHFLPETHPPQQPAVINPQKQPHAQPVDAFMSSTCTALASRVFPKLVHGRRSFCLSQKDQTQGRNEIVN